MSKPTAAWVRDEKGESVRPCRDLPVDLTNLIIVLTKLRNNGFGKSGSIIAAINLSDSDRMTTAYAHIES